MATKDTVGEFPALKRSDRNADTGKLRFGDGYIADEFPALKRSDRNADKGKLRLGDGYITGEY